MLYYVTYSIVTYKYIILFFPLNQTEHVKVNVYCFPIDCKKQWPSVDS